MLADDGSCGGADLSAFVWVIQPLLEERQEFVGGIDLGAGLGVAEYLDDVAEVPGIGAEGDGSSPGGWFDHVLTASVSEGATDEGDIGESPAGAEFADGIEESDAVVGDWSGFGCGGASKQRESCGADEGGDFIEAFAVTGHEDQLECGVLLAKFAEGIEENVFFGWLGTAGHEDRGGGVELEEFSE